MKKMYVVKERLEQVWFIEAESPTEAIKRSHDRAADKVTALRDKRSSRVWQEWKPPTQPFH